MMTVDENLMCSFQILKPAERKLMGGFGSMMGARPSTPSQRRRVQVNAKTNETERVERRRRRRRRGRRRAPTRTTDRIASPAAYLKLLAQPCVNEQPTSNASSCPVPSTPTPTRLTRDETTPTRAAHADAHRARARTPHLMSTPTEPFRERTTETTETTDRDRVAVVAVAARRSRAASPPCADETSSEGTWWPPPRCGVSEVEER